MTPALFLHYKEWINEMDTARKLLSKSFQLLTIKQTSCAEVKVGCKYKRKPKKVVVLENIK